MNRNNMCFCKLFFMRFYTNIRTFCADKKYQKAITYDKYLLFIFFIIEGTHEDSHSQKKHNFKSLFNMFGTVVCVFGCVFVKSKHKCKCYKQKKCRYTK